jgi:lipopolysaccharide cholinephosphotransferase
MQKSEAMRTDINQGIFIDIFPLDLISEDEGEYRKQMKKLKIALLNARYANPQFSSVLKKDASVKRRIFMTIKKPVFLFWGCEYWYRRFEKIAKKYNSTNGNYYGIMAFLCMNKSKKMDFKKPKVLFEEITELPFEMIKIPVPVNYEESLTAQFGDWKEFVVGGGFHSDIIFDVNHPFTKYQNGILID